MQSPGVDEVAMFWRYVAQKNDGFEICTNYYNTLTFTLNRFSETKKNAIRHILPIISISENVFHQFGRYLIENHNTREHTLFLISCKAGPLLVCQMVVYKWSGLTLLSLKRPNIAKTYLTKKYTVQNSKYTIQWRQLKPGTAIESISIKISQKNKNSNGSKHTTTTTTTTWPGDQWLLESLVNNILCPDDGAMTPIQIRRGFPI